MILVWFITYNSVLGILEDALFIISQQTPQKISQISLSVDFRKKNQANHSRHRFQFRYYYFLTRGREFLIDVNMLGWKQINLIFISIGKET